LVIFLARVAPFFIEVKFYPQSRSLISPAFFFEEVQLEKVYKDFLNIHYSILARLVFEEIFITNPFFSPNCF
jgi:hypothetical protein